jgi:hypothetical protein
MPGNLNPRKGGTARSLTINRLMVYLKGWASGSLRDPSRWFHCSKIEIRVCVSIRVNVGVYRIRVRCGVRALI